MPNLFETAYRFTNDTTLDPVELNNRFRSLDARLAALEAEKATLEAEIAALRAEGVTRLTHSLQSELPSILDAAGTGYLTGLADSSIPWSKIDLSAATPAAVGAEVAGAVALHEATPGVHSISDVADLASILAAKQNYSALLSAIAGETPTELGLIVGTGTSYEVNTLIPGDSIAITRVNGQIRIDATGSASGESNSGANLGAGVQVYEGKDGTDLRFRSLVPANPAITLTEGTDTISVGFDATRPTFAIAQITNLGPSLDSKQPLHDNLTALAGLTPTANQIVTGTDTGLKMASLIAGNNITITPVEEGFSIAAAASSYTFENLGLSAGGAGLFSTLDGSNARFKSLRSLNNALTLAPTSTTVDFDFNATTFLSGLATGAISWAKVNKTGAAPSDVGAEPAGAVATHAGGSGVHSIAGVTGLQTALNARLELIKSSVQTLDTSIAIQHATLSGTSPTPNADDDNYFLLTLTGNTTINNPTGLPSGKLQILTFLINAGTGGYTLSWGTKYLWGDSGQPTWDLAASALNLVSFLHYNGNLYCMGHKSF